MECEEEFKFELVQRLRSKLEAAGRFMIIIDGVRVQWPQGWGLVRASNTQPVLVLRFEAETQSLLNLYRSELTGALASVAKEIGHAPLEGLNA